MGSSWETSTTRSAPQPLASFQTGGVIVDGDQGPRVAQFGPDDHTQPDQALLRPPPRRRRNRRHLARRHAASTTTVQQKRHARRAARRNAMDPSQRRYRHVLGHRPLSALMEPEHIVAPAQPILPAPAVPALLAGHDLLSHDPVANPNSPAGGGARRRSPPLCPRARGPGRPEARSNGAGWRRPRTWGRPRNTSRHWRKCRRLRPV